MSRIATRVRGSEIRRSYWLHAAGIILLAIFVMIIFNDVPAMWVSMVLVPLVVIIRGNNPQPTQSTGFSVAMVTGIILLMAAFVFIVSIA